MTKLASVPPMGWNSYDCYGVAVREDEVKANADYMAAYLLKYGWQYIVVDGEWAESNPLSTGIHHEPTFSLAMDAYGRLLPDIKRFPSSATNGFKPLADYIHSKGLKFGIHIMRGVPRQAVAANTPILGTPYHAQDIADLASQCKWCPDMVGVDMSSPGGQAYYDSLVALYANWGVDFIKADDMVTPYHADEIEAIANAIKNAHREIVLSLSPGSDTAANLEYAEHLRTHAQLWRISNDMWD